MATAYLKYRDTRPILEVALKNPDDTAHDLTGATAVKLHIKRPDGTVVTRDMVVVSAAAGTVRYTWVAADWDTSNVNGYLEAGPEALPVRKGEFEHRMEYEVLGAAGARTTFPNDGYDTLRIVSDIGQG